MCLPHPVVAQPLVLQPVAPKPVSVQWKMFCEPDRLERVSEYITTEFKAHLDSYPEWWGERRKNYIRFALQALDPELPDDEGLVLTKRAEFKMLRRRRAPPATRTCGTQTMAVNMEAGFLTGRPKGIFGTTVQGPPTVDGRIALPQKGVKIRRSKLYDKWDKEASELGDEGILQVLHTNFSMNHADAYNKGLKRLVDSVGGGSLRDEIYQLGCDDSRKPLDSRKALYLMWSCGISFSCWRIKNRIEGRVGVDPGERAMLKISQEVFKEATDLVQIRDNSSDEVVGCVADCILAIKVLIAELESQGMDIHDLPSTLRFRFTLDGTILSNGVTIVVVAAVPINLPASCQSRDNIILLAILKCGENNTTMIDALNGTFDSIKKMTERGMNFHGPRFVSWIQSYDGATWWKLASQSWNSKEGNCWVCKADKTNLHLVNVWKTARVASGAASHLKTPIGLDMSGYCVLHAELRVFTDSFLNNLAYEAYQLGNAKQLEAKCKELMKSDSFYIEKDANGWVTTSACQGPQSKKLRKDIEGLIAAAGIPERVSSLKHRQVSKAKLEKMCRAVCRDGSRCQKNLSSNSKKMCTSHQAQEAEFGDILLCKASENLVPTGELSSRRADYIQLGQTMNFIFPAIQQNYPFNDHQYKIQLDGAIEHVDICGTHLMVDGEALDAADPQAECGTRIEVIACHPNAKARKKKGHIVMVCRSQEEQMEELKQETERFGELWSRLFGDERWSMYCHHLACHTVMLMELHMYLGQFSNSVLEAFHKIVRWFYQHTNREGGANKTESTEAVMTKYFGLKILEIESRSPYAKAQIQAMVRSPRAECECASSGICGWGSKKRKPEEEPEGAVYCTPCRP